MDVVEIKATLDGLGVRVTLDEIKDSLDRLAKFGVVGDEARRTVVRGFAKASGVDPKTIPRSKAPLISIGDIKSDGQWISLKVKVVELWEPTSEKIGQVGMVGDPSGIIKFTSWKILGAPLFLEGGSYLVENAVVSMFNNRFQINLNKNTSVTPLKDEIKVKAQGEEFTGALVAVQYGSGLIKRCPECKRQTKAGTCMKHGRVEDYHDIRIKAILDNGIETREIIADSEITGRITGISLAKAKEMATDALDSSVVRDKFAEFLVGKYFRVSGSQTPRYLIVKKMIPISRRPDAERIRALLEAEV